MKAVYGVQHACEEHHAQQFYKPRHLRQIRGGDTSTQVFAFPDGLPGGWNSLRKVHFVAHSLGSQTCRYLQYLLSIDYFSYLDGLDFSEKSLQTIPRPIVERRRGKSRQKSIDKGQYVPALVDKSDYIASLTALNGVLNGGPGPYALDLCQDTTKFHDKGSEKATWLSVGTLIFTKTLIVLQNLHSPYLTKDRIQDVVRKVIDVTAKEKGRSKKEKSQIL